MQSNYHFQPFTHHYNQAEMTGDCIACTETVALSSLTKVQGADVCHSCITQLFRSALEFEINYPVKWGGTVLNIDDYAHIIPAAEVRFFKAKEREYATPPGDRIYCAGVGIGIIQPQGRPACGLFLGARMPAAGARPSTNCHGCGQRSCLACGEVVEPFMSPLNPKSTAHKCKKSASASASEADAFKGLKRGKDYQVCPNQRCKRKVELQDGCNHIYCMCGASFCFICGEQAEQNGGHWKEVARGGKGCPRYNQPGAGNAIFDGGHHPVEGLGMLGMPGGAAVDAVMMRDFAQAVGGNLFAARQAFMQMPPAPQNFNNFANSGRRNAVVGGRRGPEFRFEERPESDDWDDDEEVEFAAIQAAGERSRQDWRVQEQRLADEIARAQRRQQEAELEWQMRHAQDMQREAEHTQREAELERQRRRAHQLVTPQAGGQGFGAQMAGTRQGFQARPNQSAGTGGQSFADRVTPIRNNFSPDTFGNGNTFGSTTPQPLPQARPQRQTPDSSNRLFAAAAYPQTTAGAAQGSQFGASPRRFTPAPVNNGQQGFMGPTESSSRRSRGNRRGDGSHHSPFDFTRE